MWRYPFWCVFRIVLLLAIVGLLSRQPAWAVRADYIRFDGLARYPDYDFYLYRQRDEPRGDAFYNAEESPYGTWRRRLKNGESFYFPADRLIGALYLVARRHSDGVQQVLPIRTEDHNPRFATNWADPIGTARLIHRYAVARERDRFTLSDRGIFSTLRTVVRCEVGLSGAEKYPKYQFLIGDGVQFRTSLGSWVYLDYPASAKRIPSFTVYAIPRHRVDYMGDSPVPPDVIKAPGVLHASLPELRAAIEERMPKPDADGLYALPSRGVGRPAYWDPTAVLVMVPRSVHLSGNHLRLSDVKQPITPAPMPIPTPIPTPVPLPSLDMLHAGWEHTEPVVPKKP